MRIDYESRNLQKLRNYIKECGSNNITAHYQELLKVDRNYNLVFERNSDRITKIRNEAKQYIKTLL